MNDIATRPMARASAPQDFLAGGGEMGALMRGHDWSTSPLGDPETWPQSLRTAVSLMVNSRHPMFIAWGPELAFLYNDGYIPIFGAKHPHTLGLPFRQVWSEIWDDIWPLIERALAGEATWSEDMHLVMERNGFPEDTWYSFSYSPIRDESGGIGGMFCACQETTQRIRAEDALRESEGRFRNLADHAPVMMWVTNADGQCVYLNRAWYDFTGQTRDEAEGFGWLDATHPDDKAMAEAAFLDANANQLTFRLEYRLRRKDGAYRWAIDTAAPRFGPSGEFLGYVGSVIDIDERRETENMLRESETRLRAAVQASPFPTMLHAEDGEVLELSRKWTELSGYTRDEIRTHFDWFRLAYPDSKTDFEKVIASEFAQEGEVAAGEVMIQTRGGGERIWDFHNVRVGQLPDGRRLLVSAANDVTERRAGEDRLRASEERFRALASGVPAFVWFASTDGALHYMNDRWYEYTGQSVEDALPDGWATTLHPDDAERTARAWAHSLATGDRYEIECRYRRHDGVYRWYMARAEPLRDRSGAITGWFGSSSDIEDQKRNEEHLKLLVGELNHRVKNTLAIVQSIARQSLGGSSVADGVRDDFEGRLQALAAAHNLLTRENWDSADLGDIVREVAEACHGEGRFAIDGPPVRLEPKVAVTVTMAMHELCTNAVKYGALANETGRVAVRWTANRRLHLRWEESGGPPVTPPTRRGFGSRMIERALASELNAAVNLDFRPGGLVCEIVAELPARAPE